MKKRKALVTLALTGLLAIGGPAATANAAWKTTSSGTIYTQTAKPGYLTGFQKIDKKVYYFNGQGILQKGWITVDKKRYYADAKTGECWCVLLCFFPLVNEDDEKKCCHTEINARQVELYDLTEDAAKNRTNHPITAAEQCNEEHGVLLFFWGEI